MPKLADYARLLATSLEAEAPDVSVVVVEGPDAGLRWVLSPEGAVRLGTCPPDFPVTEYPLKRLFTVGANTYYAEAAARDPEVLVLGAGHVSRAIADILVLIGCRVTVVDDRAEYLRPEFFPEPVQRVCLSFENLEELPLHRYGGIITVTRAHEFDSVCLRQLRPYLGVYVGIMGSKKRVHHVREALRGMGWTDEELGRIHGPIGLEIGAQTPAEIGLSIVSEYLSVVRGCWPVQARQYRGQSS